MSLERRTLEEDLCSSVDSYRSAVRLARERLTGMDQIVDDTDCREGERAAEPVRAVAMAVEALGRIVVLRKTLMIFDAAMANKTAADEGISAHARALADGQRRRAAAGPDPEDEL